MRKTLSLPRLYRDPSVGEKPANSRIKRAQHPMLRLVRRTPAAKSAMVYTSSVSSNFQRQLDEIQTRSRHRHGNILRYQIRVRGISHEA